MSNAVLTPPPGRTPNVTRSPVWATARRSSVSGREYRTAQQSYPHYRINWEFEFLRQGQNIGAAYTEFSDLVGFFNARQGGFDSFLITDPDDNTATAQVIGIGNGSATQFQLVRNFGGFVEPVFDVNGTPELFKDIGYGPELLYTTARTNVLLNSEDMANTSAWLGNPSRTAAAALFGLPAWTLAKTTGVSSEGLSRSFTRPSAASYAFKIALLAGSVSQASVGLYDGAGTAWGVAGDSSGTIISGPGSITRATGALFIVTGLSAVTPTLVQIVRNYTLAGGGGVYIYPDTSSSTTSGASMVASRPLVEQAAVAGSHIPTTTTPVTVTDYSLSSTGLATLSPAPASGAVLTWSGSFYRRVTFVQDQAELQQFLRNLWRWGRVELKTAKP